MEQRSRDAVMRDAQTLCRREESAEGMGQKQKLVATRDATTMPRREESALSTVQNRSSITNKIDIGSHVNSGRLFLD